MAAVGLSLMALARTRREADANRMLREEIMRREATEEALRQAQKMEAVGRLTGGIAHDLNNMLMILTGYSEELLNGMPAGSPLRGDVQEILAATGRMNGLTTQLLAFARHQVNAAGTISLETVLSGMKNRLQSLTGAGLHLDFKFSSDAGEVKAEAFVYIDKETRLPLRTEVNAESSGNVKGVNSARVIAEMRDINTNVDSSMFDIPAGYAQVPPEKVRQQIDALTSTVAAILKAMIANMRTEAGSSPMPTSSPQ